MANESEKGFEEIRREVIESRNLVIKTDNQLKTLHAELKQVGRRQEEFEKRQWLSSAAAYLAFVGLCIGGVVVITNARTSSAANERERLEKQVKDLQAEISTQKTGEAADGVAERAAVDVYKMMTSLPGDERLKGVDALAKLDQSRLSPLAKLALQDRAIILRQEVGNAMLERGKSAFRRQEYQTAVNELSRFLALKPATDDEIEASYFLGNSYIQLRKYEEGITHLRRFVDGDRRAKGRDFAMLMLMQAYDATSQREKATDTAREALNTYPASEFLNGFRNRLARKNEANAPPGGAAPTGAPPAATPPAAAPANKPAPPAAAAPTGAAAPLAKPAQPLPGSPLLPGARPTPTPAPAGGVTPR